MANKRVCGEEVFDGTTTSKRLKLDDSKTAEQNVMEDLKLIKEELFNEWKATIPELFEKSPMHPELYYTDFGTIHKRKDFISYGMVIHSLGLWTLPLTHLTCEYLWGELKYSEFEKIRHWRTILLEKLPQSPVFYEPGLFSVLDHGYKSKCEHDREQDIFEEDAIWDEVSWTIRVPRYSNKFVGEAKWNRDSVLHWAMRISCQFKPSPYCQGKAFENSISGLQQHFGDKRYKKMLLAILFCQETLHLVGQETWCVFPLQKAYGLEVSSSVSTPQIELDMMKLMKCKMID